MPVISRTPADLTKKSIEEVRQQYHGHQTLSHLYTYLTYGLFTAQGRGSNLQSVSVPARPGYLRPTNASLLRSGKEPKGAITRTRPRPVAAPPPTTKATPVAFGTAIRPECKKVVASPPNPTATLGGAVYSKRLSSTPAVRPTVAAAPTTAKSVRFVATAPTTTESARPVTAAPNVRVKASVPAKVPGSAMSVRTTQKVCTSSAQAHA